MKLTDLVVELMDRVAALERRADIGFRHGTVEEVDAERQRARLRIGERDSEAFLTPWVPYAQVAGAYKWHNPPSVGQQMTLFDPAGDPRQGVLLPFTWSNQNESPSGKPDEHIMTFGQVRVEVREAEVIVSVGSNRIRITTDEILSEVGGTSLSLTSGNLKGVSDRIDWNP